MGKRVLRDWFNINTPTLLMKHRMIVSKYFFHLLLIGAVLTSCGRVESYSPNEEPFVDLNAWFNSELEDLADIELRKRSIWNEHVAPDTTYAPDWKKELNLFLSLPLTPSSWKSDYHLVERHEFPRGSGFDRFSYGANSSENRLQTFSISFSNGQIAQVELNFSTSHMFKTAEKELIYRAGEGYEIKGRQKTRFFPEEKFEIQGTFVHPE